MLPTVIIVGAILLVAAAIWLWRLRRMTAVPHPSPTNESSPRDPVSTEFLAPERRDDTATKPSAATASTAHKRSAEQKLPLLGPRGDSQRRNSEKPTRTDTSSGALVVEPTTPPGPVAQEEVTSKGANSSDTKWEAEPAPDSRLRDTFATGTRKKLDVVVHNPTLESLPEDTSFTVMAPTTDPPVEPGDTSRNIGSPARTEGEFPEVRASEAGLQPEMSQPLVDESEACASSETRDRGHARASNGDSISTTKAPNDSSGPTNTQPNPSANRPATAKVTEIAGRSDNLGPPSDEQLAKKKRTATRYQPAARTPKTTRRRKRTAPVLKSSPDRKTNRARSLSMSVHVSFGRRNRCKVSLLPSRALDMPESVEVKQAGGLETWDALQDEWYSNVLPVDLGAALRRGRVWELADTSEDTAWSFSGRDICVLAQGSTISGYVSVPRLMLGEDHVVLCTKQSLEAVQDALRAAGCSMSDPKSGGGIPSGWCMLSGVRPTVAVAHDSEAGIINILRPIQDVEITLRHGIRLSHSKWLCGHPPTIGVRGHGELHVDVLIDEQPARLDESGGFVSSGWDDRGIHTVFCGGQTQAYEIVEGASSWQPFQSFTYRPTQGRAPKHEIVICGPIVDVIGDTENALLTPSTNSLLLGAVPGQIASSSAPYDSLNREYLALADFPVVWTAPPNALRCDKSNACVRLIQFEEAENGRDVPTGTSREDVLRWCQAILDASRKRLPVTPHSDSTLELWLGYKKVARRLWRKLR